MLEGMGGEKAHKMKFSRKTSAAIKCKENFWNGIFAHFILEIFNFFIIFIAQVSVCKKSENETNRIAKTVQNDSDILNFPLFLAR